MNDKKDPKPKADTSQWFRVKKLVKTKKLNDGKRYFLVKWAHRRNQKQFKDTWKPEENISEYASRDFTLTELNRIIEVITLVDDIKYVK